MEVSGKVESILPKVTGNKKDGGTWEKQTFVVRTNEEYNNLYPIEAFGKSMEQMSKLKVGQEVTVNFNINANEHQGKYYVSFGLWKVDVDSDVATPAQPKAISKQEEAFANAGNDGSDDLPF